MPKNVIQIIIKQTKEWRIKKGVSKRTLKTQFIRRQSTHKCSFICTTKMPILIQINTGNTYINIL